VPAGCKTSGLLFLGEFTKEETSVADSHLSGHGWSSSSIIFPFMNLWIQPILEDRTI